MGNIFKSGAKINLGIILLPLVVGTIASMVGLKLLEANCKSELWKQYYSPDKKWKVVLIKKDCGALSELEFHGDIVRIGDTIDHSDDNLFAFYSMESTDQIKELDKLIDVSWVNNSKVSVVYDERLDHINKYSIVNGVKIKYIKKKRNNTDHDQH